MATAARQRQNAAMKLEESSDEVRIEPAAPARASIIWLHGLGASGHDFVSIVPELRLPPDTAVRFIFPHAPLRPVTLNNGLPLRAWYDLSDFSPHQKQDAAGINASAQRIRARIDAEIDAGIPAGRIVLAGYSQGGAIALHAGLRLDLSLGGLVALSSYLPLHETLDAEATAAARATPLFIAHGNYDTVVPTDWGEKSAQGLQARGYSVDWHRYPMGHEVCAEEIDTLGAWLSWRLRAGA